MLERDTIVTISVFTISSVSTTDANVVFTDEKQKTKMMITNSLNLWAENDSQIDNPSAYFIIIPPRCDVPPKQISEILHNRNLRPSYIYFMTSELYLNTAKQTPFVRIFEEDLRKTCGEPHNGQLQIPKFIPLHGLLKLNNAQRMEAYLKQDDNYPSNSFKPDPIDVVSSIKVFLPGTSLDSIVPMMYPYLPKSFDKDSITSYENLWTVANDTMTHDLSTSTFTTVRTLQNNNKNLITDTKNTTRKYPIWLNKETALKKRTDTPFESCAIFLAGSVEFPSPVLIQSLQSVPRYSLFGNPTQPIPFERGLPKNYTFKIVAFIATLIKYCILCLKTTFTVFLLFMFYCLLCWSLLNAFLFPVKERGLIMFLVQLVLISLFFYYTPYMLNQKIARFPLNYYAMFSPKAMGFTNNKYYPVVFIAGHSVLYQEHMFLSVLFFKVINCMLVANMFEHILIAIIIISAPVKGILSLRIVSNIITKIEKLFFVARPPRNSKEQ